MTFPSLDDQTVCPRCSATYGTWRASCLACNYPTDPEQRAALHKHEASVERYHRDMMVWKSTLLLVGQPLTLSNVHAVTPGVIVEIWRYESTWGHSGPLTKLTHHITKRTKPDVWDMSMWIKKTHPDGRYEFNPNPINAGTCLTSEVLRLNAIVHAIPTGPKPQPRWEDYR